MKPSKSWFILAIALIAVGFLLTPAGATTSYYFDMNESTPTQSGWTGVRITDTYTLIKQYGWDSSIGLTERDRGAYSDPLSNLLRDFHFAPNDRTFKADLPVGNYKVTLYFRDPQYMHDKINVYAEGITEISNLTVPKSSTPTITTFNVAVNDGQIDLQFHKGSGYSDPNWIINAISVVPIPLPSTILLLGSGLVGLGLLRRKWGLKK